MAAFVKPIIRIIETESVISGASGVGIVIPNLPRKFRIWRIRGLRTSGTGVTFTVFEVQKVSTVPVAALGDSSSTVLRSNNAAAANPMDWQPTMPIMVESVLVSPEDAVGSIALWIDPDAAWTGTFVLELEVCA